MTSNKPIRVGIVGVGNWARHGHLRVLQLLPSYELTAIYSQRQAAAETAAGEYGIKYVLESLDQLVTHPEVDLVIVVTTASANHTLTGLPWYVGSGSCTSSIAEIQSATAK